MFFFKGDGNFTFDEFVQLMFNMGNLSERSEEQEEQELRQAFKVNFFHKTQLIVLNCKKVLIGVR